MKLFNIQNFQVIIDPEVLTVPQFAKIYKRDKNRTKTIAFNEFAYIYHFCDWNSPYRRYGDPIERKEKVKEAFIHDDKWKEDQDIIEAIKAYENFSKTPSMGLLEDATHLVLVLGEYCKRATIDNIDPTKAGAILEKLPKIVESLKSLEQTVAKEKSETGRIRGNKRIAYDED